LKRRMAGSSFRGLLEKFKERFLLSGKHAPYLPERPTAFRYPAPVDQPRPTVPRTSAERGYNTTYFDRPAIKSGKAQYDSKQRGQYELPKHISKPLWMNEKDLKELNDKFAGKGFIPVGKFFDYRKEGYVPSYLDHSPYLKNNRIRRRPIQEYAAKKAELDKHAAQREAQKQKWIDEQRAADQAAAASTAVKS